MRFYHLFRKLDIAAFERVLADWAAPLLQATAAGGIEAVAVDGKWLRGSAKRGTAGAHLLAAVSHRLQQTVGQVAIVDGDEVGACRTLLAELLLEGRVLTLDALFTQRDLADTVVERGGDYVMVVKGNQPELQEATATVFTAPPPASRPRGSARSSATTGTAALKPAR